MKDFIVNNIQKLKNDTLEAFRSIFLNVGIKLDNNINSENKIEGINIIQLLKNINDEITFLYLELKNKKINQKFFKEFLEQKNYGNDIGNCSYLVLFIKNEIGIMIYGVDILNKSKIKISSFKIDVEGFEDYKTSEIKYRNRTLNEQLNNLAKNINFGEREVSRRFIIEFFEKKNLTEEFYKIYKNNIFEEIKKLNRLKFGLEQESKLNNFILINLNRLLFIHFLDKKGDIFQPYDKRFGSFLAYLKYNLYRKINNKKSFYENILKILFFEIFNKPKKERNLEKLEEFGLKDIFYDLPYLNGGLFKEQSFDKIGFEIEDDLIDLFIEKIIDGFNFTIEEDTPLEVKISVDPELLGYIFENLIQEYDNNKNKDDNERSRGGIFYTPKVEVDFMCRQSIVEYLTKKGLDKGELYKLVYREKGEKGEQLYGEFSKNDIEKIFEELEKLTIVDPACGSGAFLVGMLQTILDIEDTLKEHHIKYYNELIKDFKIQNKELFTRKKDLIKNTLYGVDVKTWAVEIAKLRLWLSMILDVDSDYFKTEESKNNPLLPNFGFKIVAGDSLVNKIGDKLIPIDFTKSMEVDTKLKNKIKKIIELKNDFFDNKIKDEQLILNEEKNVYISILNEQNKIINEQISNISNKLNNTQIGLFETEEVKLDKKEKTRLEKKQKELYEKIKSNDSLKDQISLNNNLPFAWSIDFAEVFSENGGFDILIGNPPYVGYKRIGDPNEIIKNNADYRKLLSETIKNDYLNDINNKFGLDLKIGGKSDLYIYFYFRGLKLLNTNGIFSFITSNSWLDVDFGAVLQEFLLRFVDNITIYDNSAERSFEHASINTIIAIFDKPRLYKKDMKYKKDRDLETDFGETKFINFKKSFEEVIFSENFREFEDIYKQPIVKNLEEKTIKIGEIEFRKKSNDDFRVIYINNKSLYIDGSEKEISKIGKDIYKYIGNKWGGKYFKAPDIFFEILNKSKGKLVNLENITEKILTGIKDSGYNKYIKKLTKEYNDDEGIKILKNVKKHFNIEINNFDSYISYDFREIINKNKNKQANILWTAMKGERYITFKTNSNVLFTGNFIGIYVKKNIYEINLLLNTTITHLFGEIYGRQMFGEGSICLGKSDLLRINFIFDNNILNKLSLFSGINREIKSIFEELGFDKTKPIREQEPNPLADRKELDDIIFDEIGLSEEERKEVYWSLGELVKSRLDKAKSK